MFRTLALFCVVTLFSFVAAFAQDQPGTDKIKVTPEILAILDETLQTLAQTEPTPRSIGLFQLLGFAARLDDKAPAKKIIDALEVLIPTIETEELRNELYEGIAHTLCDHEEYAEAIGTLQRIVKSADRYKRQLNLAIKIILGHEQDQTLKPFDASALIRQAIGGAVEAQDNEIEALARLFLGRELVRQGKPEEAAAAFAEATKIVKNIKEAAEQVQIIQLVIQSQVQNGQTDEALATAQTMDVPEIKRHLHFAAIQALIQFEKYDEAEKLIKDIPADNEGREGLVQQWIVANIKSISDEKIGELSTLLSEEQRESFLQAATTHLQKINRGEVAIQVSKRMKESAAAERALFLGKVESLTDEKRFAEAIQFIEASKEDDTIRQRVKRQVLLMQFNETHEESVLQQIAETFTSEEKVALGELREEAAEAVALQDSEERMNVMFEVMIEQLQFADIAGVRQTVQGISEQIAKESDPILIMQFRLILAQLQAELRDTEGMKENLGKLMQVLDAKDVNVFKGLIPEEHPETASAGIASSKIKIDLLAASQESVVDESVIRERLFCIYMNIAEVLVNADAPVESKSALEKAKELARLETDALKRVEKLLTLLQIF